MIPLFRMINLIFIVMSATIIAIILLDMKIEIRYNHNQYESANNSFLTRSNKAYRSDTEVDSSWHEQILIKSELKSNVLNDQITKTSTAFLSSNIKRQHLSMQPLLSNFSRRKNRRNEQQSSIPVTPTSVYPSVSSKSDRAESSILSLSRLLRLQIPSSFTIPSDKQIVPLSISIASKSRSFSHVTRQKSATKKRKKRDREKIIPIHKAITKAKKPTISHNQEKAHAGKAKKQKASTRKGLKKTVAKPIDLGRRGVIKSSKSAKLLSKRTKPTIVSAKDNLFISKKPMYVTIQSRNVFVPHIPRKTTEKSKIPGKRESGGKRGLIGGIIGGIIVFFITGAGIAGSIHRRKMKKKSTKTQKQKDKVKSGVVPVVSPQVSDTPWAPDVINAQQFQYKGPLNLYISHPTDLKHDLENLAVESPNAENHIVFDDNLNQVYEIGSEIEILIDQKIAQSGAN